MWEAPGFVVHFVVHSEVFDGSRREWCWAVVCVLAVVIKKVVDVVNGFRSDVFHSFFADLFVAVRVKEVIKKASAFVGTSFHDCWAKIFVCWDNYEISVLSEFTEQLTLVGVEIVSREGFVVLQ